MKAEEIRKIGTIWLGKHSGVDEFILDSRWELVLRRETCAQLAELNENLKSRPNNGQPDDARNTPEWLAGTLQPPNDGLEG